MSKQVQAWIFLFILALIWGSSFILMKLGMYDAEGNTVFTDPQVASLRMLIASTILLPFGIRFMKKIRSFNDVIALVVVGTCGNFVPAFLFTYAETELSSGMAGMLNSFTPFFTLIIGVIFFRQPTNMKQLGGLLLAFLGMCILVGLFQMDLGKMNLPHITAILFATLLYGTSLNTIKYKLAHFEAMEIAALSFSFLFIPAVLVSLMFGVSNAIYTEPAAWTSLSFIAILSVFGTCLALLLFNHIIALKSPVFASTVAYFIPVVALVLGVVFYHETFDFSQLLGVAVVIVGVLVVNLNFKKV